MRPGSSRAATGGRWNLDLALLILRAVLGVIFLFHGSQKLFGLFGGPGLVAFTQVVARAGLSPAQPLAVLASLAEFLGGLIMLLGIATEVGALAIIATMAVAIWKFSGYRGFSVTQGGFEYNVLIIAACLALLLVGPGRYALWRLGRR